MSIRRPLDLGFTSAASRVRLLVGVTVVLGYLASGAASALGASTATVDVGGASLSFTQPNTTINPGDTIHWVWLGSGHSVTSGALPPAGNGAFDAGVQAAGFTFDQTFSHPGVYHYFCKIHYLEGMVGTITVTGTAPSPTAAFAPSSATPTAGQAVSFDAGASLAPSGYTLESYSWDFGDGTTATTTTPSTSHVYAGAGPRTVSLSVTDDGSAVSPVVTQALNVQPAAATPPPPPPPNPKPKPKPKPKATKLKLGASTLCVKKTKKCAHTGASVSFTLSRAVSVKEVLERGGHKVRQKNIRGKTGKNSFKLSAAGLRTGSYKLVLTPSGGKAVTAGFKVRKD